MRKLLLTAVAVTAISTPALARDGSPYVGVEGGVMWVSDDDAEYQGFDGSLDTDIDINHKLGFDADIIAGYDFGPVRAEAELAYKRASVDEVGIACSTAICDDEFGVDDGGRARTVSAMVNVLGDFGDDEGTSFYIGGGAGVARTKYRLDALSFGATDSNLAWQLIAGVRTRCSPA